MHRSACRTLTALALGAAVALAPATAAQAEQRGAWGTPASVAGANSSATEGCPMEAPDGRSLYLMSTRDGGDQDIWVAPRAEDGTIGEPVILPEPVNSPTANDFCPTPLRGGSLLFVSNRGGTDAYGTVACGGGDIYVTRQSRSTGEWAEPRNLGCVGNGGPNGSGHEFGPSVVETSAGTHLYYSSGVGGMGSDTQDIYVSRQWGDGSFGPREAVAALNTTTADDAMPNVRKDGLEVVFTSSRPGGQGGFDIWSASRSSVDEPWSRVVNVAAVNTGGSETRPSLSWKASRLYFGRSGDIFLATR